MPDTNTQFAGGATVRLKSGGPVMTVKGKQNASLLCQWFVGTKLESGTFSPESLVAVNLEDEPGILMSSV